MLPSWCYIFIFILGVWSSHNADRRITSILFIGYWICMSLMSVIPMSHVGIYVFSRALLLLLYFYLTWELLEPCNDPIKVYLPLIPVIACELAFTGAIALEDISLLVAAVWLTPHAFDLYTIVIGINNWHTPKQAAIGTSIGFFYVFHFTGLL